MIRFAPNSRYSGSPWKKDGGRVRAKGGDLNFRKGIQGCRGDGGLNQGK